MGWRNLSAMRAKQAQTAWASVNPQRRARVMFKFLELVQRDEARHIAFGVYFLQRHVQANPQLWNVIEARMSELLPAALEVVGDVFIPYGDSIPFNLDVAEMVIYASEQFNKRLHAIERVKQ